MALLLCQPCLVNYNGCSAPADRNNFCGRCDLCLAYGDVFPVQGGGRASGRTETPMKVTVTADNRHLVTTAAVLAELVCDRKAEAIMADELTGERFIVKADPVEDPDGLPNGLGFIIIGRC